jgi:NADH-quinone oxidoreductase subunit L
MLHLWLIPALPLAGFLANGLFCRRAPKSVVNAIAIGSVLLSFLWVVKTLLALGPLEQAHVERYYTWIQSGDFRVGFDLAVDRLTAVMLLVVTGRGCSFTSTRSATWPTRAATTASSPT